MALGQRNSARDLRYILGVLSKRSLGYDIEYRDDYFRKSLKAISAYAFQRVFKQGPVWMLFTHLHNLTGKAPYNKDELMETIRVWVSPLKPDGKTKALNEEAVNTGLDQMFVQWMPDGRSNLPFREYANDFMRWGTSGGAPRSTWFGEKYRTKWAWAFSRATGATGDLKRSFDLYNHSLAQPNIAKVALKEQPDKTRTVITTPMASYLRQSYLLYRRIKPPLQSPAYSRSWARNFEASAYSWMGCVDGDSFDQCIPKSFIVEFIRRLGDIDDESRAVAQEEISALDTLMVEWGSVRFPWQGGILSGWKLTSILGSAVTHCAVEYIRSRTGYGMMLQEGELGDDLILFSRERSMSTKELVDLYNEFGLTANMYKTTSGPVGEFLRKVVSAGGSWGYPALSLRSIVYASPWVSSYDFEQEDELSSVHLTFLSRLLPHRCRVGIESFCESLFVDNMSYRFGPGRWADWYHTPVSAGGGGPIELSDPNRWVQMIRDVRKERFVAPQTVLPALVGVLKKRILFSSAPRFNDLSYRLVQSTYKWLLQDVDAPAPLAFAQNVNITRTIYDFLFGRINRSGLSSALLYPLPRSMRGMDPVDIIAALLVKPTAGSAVTTITHTKESIASLTSLTSFISKCVSKSKRFSRPYTYKPLITYYFMVTYDTVKIPYGTW